MFFRVVLSSLLASNLLVTCRAPAGPKRQGEETEAGGGASASAPVTKRPKFARPTVDVAFKHLLKGDEPQLREMTLSFLSAMTGENVTSFSFIPEAFPEIPDTTPVARDRQKQTFLDFACKDQKGQKILVEMQVRHEDFFDQRPVYYAAGVYAGQLKRGESWSSLKRVIALQFLEHDTRTLERDGDFEKHYQFLDTLHLTPEQREASQKKLPVIPSIELRQIELPRVPLEDLSHESTAMRDQWLRFFCEANLQEEIPEGVPPVIRQAYERVAFDKWGEDMRGEYRIQEALDRGRYQEVLKKEREAGKAEGLEEGRARGIEEGKIESAYTLALQFVTKGRLSLDEAIEEFQLSDTLAQRLRESLEEKHSS